MHKVVIKPEHIERVKRRSGREHTVDALHGPETALLVVDMQLYFVGEGQPSECPVAREIVPNINLLADLAPCRRHRNLDSNSFRTRVKRLLVSIL